MILGYKANYKETGSFQRSVIYDLRRIPLYLKISNAGVYPFYIIADVQNYSGKEIKYQRETYCEERGVDEEKPDFTDRYIKAFAQIGANPKRVSFKKCEDPL